ncbi:MAG: bacillithiol biosynthesis BshC, partial [Geothrix sp.]|nr:bacillithiol biosynthesis BshC [Geothrix sp.]
MNPRPVIATGQQIGAGWSPALSVAKAMAALAEARRTGGEAVYWLADEDHDRAEVATVAGWAGPRLIRHRFRFDARLGTATGWLPWTPAHQVEASALWGSLPEPQEPTLRGHVLTLGQPLWDRGLRPFSPTDPRVREPIQGELERWRTLDLEALLVRQALALEAEGAPLPLDPRVQAAWFSLDPHTGRRQRLDSGAPLPKGCWLSPGAAIRPLMQSLLLPVAAVVLGPSERAYWRLCEPLWERVGL